MHAHSWRTLSRTLPRGCDDGMTSTVCWTIR